MIDRLTTVRGIGRWTAEMFLMFQLRRLDVWPIGDLGVRKGFGVAWRIPMPSAKELAPLGDPFRPYRSAVAWYCWRADRAGPGQPGDGLTPVHRLTPDRERPMPASRTTRPPVSGASARRARRLRMTPRLGRRAHGRRTSPAGGAARVFYQVYVRSFADSNDDGVGDLRGLLGRLDHLAWLGVDALWLSPVMPSPNADWGYDVADYCAVLPEYGTMDDLDEVIAAAGRAGIRVLLDLVPNHTSDRHPWFVEARSVGRLRSARLVRVGRPQARRVAAEQLGGQPSAARPGPSTPPRGSTTCTTSCPSSPTSTGGATAVRDAFDDIVRFWWDRGVAGFRIDVCNMMIKDAAAARQPARHRGRPLHHADVRPAPGLQRQPARGPRHPAPVADDRRSATPRPGCCLGETNVDTLENLATYYGTGRRRAAHGVQLPLHRGPLRGRRAGRHRGPHRVPAARRRPGRCGRARTTTCRAWPPGGAGATRAKVRLALLMLLTLRGTPVLYQGDEIGLTDRAFEKDELLDPVGLRFWPHYPGPRPRAHPHALGRRAQRRLHRGRGHALAAPGATRR